MYGVCMEYPPFSLSAGPYFIGLLRYPNIGFLTIWIILPLLQKCSYLSAFTIHIKALFQLKVTKTVKTVFFDQIDLNRSLLSKWCFLVNLT